MSDNAKRAMELCEAATDGPWGWMCAADGDRIIGDIRDDGACEQLAVMAHKGLNHSMQLMAESRELLPALANEVIELRAAVERLKVAHDAQ